MRRLLLSLAVAAFAAGPSALAAEVVRIEESDGTVHLTNAPSDPRYRQRGASPPRPAPPPAVIAATATVRTPPSIGLQIRDAAERYGLSEQLVAAVIRVESGFNPRAVSPKGAQGLMQLMPATATQLGVRNVFDVAENIDGGVRHLRGLMERFSNNLPLALAAYNAGERAVQQYGGIPPYPETEQYVARILGIVGGGPAASEAPAAEPSRTPTYLYEQDGATVYSNIPPRRR